LHGVGKKLEHLHHNHGLMAFADFKGELTRLNRELLFVFLDLLDCLVQRPSAYARAAENVGVVARNMSYLLNALRSEQVLSFSSWHF